MATVSLLVAATFCRWLAFNPPAWPIFAFLWLAIASIAAIRARSIGLLLAAAFAIDLVWWLEVEQWVAEVSVAGYPVMCGYLALWGVAFAWLVRRFATRPPTDRLPLWVVLPFVTVALDFLRGELVLGGYPWYEAGQALVGWNTVAQSADLVGARGLTIIVAVFAGAIAELARPRSRGLLGLLAPLPVLLVFAVFAIGYGSWR